MDDNICNQKSDLANLSLCTRGTLLNSCFNHTHGLHKLSQKVPPSFPHYLASEYDSLKDNCWLKEDVGLAVQTKLTLKADLTQGTRNWLSP